MLGNSPLSSAPLSALATASGNTDLSASAGALVLAGQAATFTASNTNTTFGSTALTLSGSSASFAVAYGLTAAAGSLALAGSSATFTANAFPYIVGTGTESASTSGVFTPSMPSETTQAGDLFVFTLETANETVSVSGWTQAGSSPAVNSGTDPTSLHVWYKRATSGSTTAPSTNSLTGHAFGSVTVYRAVVSSGDPFDVTASSSGGVGTAITIPGATTTTDNTRVILAASSTVDASGAIVAGGGATSPSLSNTGTVVNQSTSLGSGGGVIVVTGQFPGHGAYSSSTTTQQTAVEWTAWTGALKPAAIGNTDVSASAGSMTLTGQSATFSVSATTTFSAGSLTLTGQSATFVQSGLNTVFSAGALTLTGGEVDFFYNYSESFSLGFIVDLLPSVTSRSQEYDVRLTVDGTQIKVKEWTFREEDQALTGRLDVQLANVADRSLITRDSSITFEIGQKIDGYFQYETLVNTGQLDRTDYNVSRGGIGPADSFTLTTKPAMLVKLEKTPLNGYVLYDPAKHEIDEADWPIIYDTKANAYTPAFTQIPGMDLYTVLNAAFVTGCGFSAVNTNIPNFEVGIVEFRAGESFMNTVSGLIGMFEPDFTEARGVLGNTELWIRDGTSGNPRGMPRPRRLGVSEAKQIGVSADHNRCDAILLTYIADLRQYDSTADRTETKTAAAGSGDTYSETVTVTHFKDYFRESNPTVPVRVETTRVTVDVYHNVKGYDVTTNLFGLSLELTESSDEVFTYDPKGRLIRRAKTAQKRLPNADNSFTVELIDAESTLETLTYKMHPYKPMRTYVSQRVINTSGLIFVDGDNQQLGEDYGQDANKVYQSGNVTDTQIAVWGSTYTYRETGKPLRNGKVRYHIIEIDQALGTVTRNEEEERDGDLGVSSYIQEPRQVYVLQTDDHVRTTDHIEERSSGEAPLYVGIPLARRILLKLNTYPNNLAFELIGIDNTLQKGTNINAIGRDGEDLGNYVIEARELRGKKDEWMMSVQVRQAN